ncbi:MAG: Gmad2 immunoglobulin-like domain-containing protein [Vallitaleaceae bacterium]|nr:Gmad2 immunoglobulin-like domain-containing protein [Vallitaleaceae bacterium]
MKTWHINTMMVLICITLFSGCGQNDNNLEQNNQSSEAETSSDLIEENEETQTTQAVNETVAGEAILENEAFRIYEPVEMVNESIVIRGLASVYEGTVSYEFTDGKAILDKGFTTATEGAPGWGEFEIIIELKDLDVSTGTIVIFQESAEDGSRLNELSIAVEVEK